MAAAISFLRAGTASKLRDGTAGRGMKPLTDKQKFALRAVEKGVVRQKEQRFGWRTVTKFYAWDSDITTQIKSLLRTHRLIRWRREGLKRVLELRPQKENA